METAFGATDFAATAFADAAFPDAAELETAELETVGLLADAFDAPLWLVPVVFDAESNCLGSSSSPKLSNRTSFVRFVCICRFSS